VFSDFDNTLVHSFYDQLSDDVEKVRFWEKYCENWVLRFIYGIISQFDYLLFRRGLYNSKDDNTEGFLRIIDVPIIIHSMSPEIVIKRTLRECFK
jgi:hypothetical protein